MRLSPSRSRQILYKYLSVAERQICQHPAKIVSPAASARKRRIQTWVLGKGYGYLNIISDSPNKFSPSTCYTFLSLPKNFVPLDPSSPLKPHYHSNTTTLLLLTTLSLSTVFSPWPPLSAGPPPHTPPAWPVPTWQNYSPLVQHL